MSKGRGTRSTAPEEEKSSRSVASVVPSHVARRGSRVIRKERREMWCDGSGSCRISGGLQVLFSTDLCGSLFALEKAVCAPTASSSFAPFVDQHDGEKRDDTAKDLASLRSRYHIPDYFELLAPSARETFRSHYEGCVCLNEWMFKAGVRIPFDFDILELLHAFGAAPI
ncbi:hypothetical protein ACLOJK_006419 [Asimina triloba]